MKKIIMLTQDNCTKCVTLKLFLEAGLKNQYAQHIEIVKREVNSKQFNALVRKHGIMTTPALIADDALLLNPDATNTEAFIKAHI